jgi:hypothetical protein
LNAGPLFKIFWLCLLFANPTGEQLLLESYTLRSCDKEEGHISFFCVPNKWLNRSLKKSYMLFLLKKGNRSLYD